MLACRSLFWLERAWIYTNSCVKLKPFRQGQVRSTHSSLNFKFAALRKMNERDFVDQKTKRKISAVWRPVRTLSTSAQEFSKELEVEVEDVQEVDGVEKVEVCQVLETAARYESADLADSSAKFQSHDEGGVSLVGSMPSENKHSISLKVGASLMRFVKGRWGSTQKKIEDEIGVKLIFPLSRQDDDLVIEGTSVDSITRASERVQNIIDEVVKSPSLDYSHFVSLPLAIHSELVDKLINFQNSVLGTDNLVEDEKLDSDLKEDTLDDEDEDKESDEQTDVAVKMEVVEDEESVKLDITKKIRRVNYAPKSSNPSERKPSDMGIEKSIFIKPATFHLTVLMLKLWNEDRVSAAAEVLQSVASKVVEALDNRPISIRLKGLECMRGKLAKARVVYAPVEEIGGEGRLGRACQVIIDAFVEAGLVLEKDARHNLKLHATVMNARHRKRKNKKRNADSFDARDVFKQYGSEEWGEYLIREAHLSQRFVFDESGYYHCCSSIPFPSPSSMELD